MHGKGLPGKEQQCSGCPPKGPGVTFLIDCGTKCKEASVAEVGKGGKDYKR